MKWLNDWEKGCIRLHKQQPDIKGCGIQVIDVKKCITKTNQK